jgi:hypothetical protein
MRRCLLGLLGLLPVAAAHAWGDEGHEIVALIADHYLSAPVKSRVEALLAQDRSGLLPETSMAVEATWADVYRDSDRPSTRTHYQQTRDWHFVDLERGAPNLARACYGRSALAPGTPASQGPAEDCIVDKIEQFDTELSDRRTPLPERVLALQFLLHLVGDLHQPLHAADDEDQGGNRKRVDTRGWGRASLHHYWDTEFVSQLGADPHAVAAALISAITATDLQAWRRGSIEDWTRESFALGKALGYDALPSPDERGRYRLSDRYVADAVSAVRLQLSRAGIRLAMLLNRDLGRG